MNYPSQNPMLHPSSCCHLKREPMVRWPCSMKEQGGPCHFVKTIWHYDNRAGSRWESVHRDKGSISQDSLYTHMQCHCNLPMTPHWKWPFFTSDCIHYIVCENGRISGMKINTIETKGMKFSWEVGAPATQWVLLCHKLFPPKWFHASASAASAATTTTVDNKTWETYSVLKFINILWFRYKQHVS